MPILHMETDLVRGTGQRLVQSSHDVADAAGRIAGAWAALADQWQGPARDQFAAEIESVIHSLRSQAETGEELGIRTQREAEEWEEVDSSGASALAGLGTPT